MSARQPTLVAAAIFGFAALSWSGHAPRTGAQPPKGPAAADAHGDPLPSAAALQRLGTVRLRHGSRVLCLAYAPGGKMLAAGGGNDPVRLWDADGKLVRTLKDTWAHAVAFSPNGQVIATGGGFKTIRLWDAASGKELRQLKGSEGTVLALAFSPDGTLLASGGQDRKVRLWDVASGKPLATYEGHQDEVTCVAFGAEGKTIASGSGDRTIRIWNGKPPLEMKSGGAVLALAYSSDGKILATAGDDNVIRVWDPAAQKEKGQLRGHKDAVTRLAFAGGKLFSTGRDLTVRCWDVDKMGAAWSADLKAGEGEGLAVTSDGKAVAVAGMNNTVRRLDGGSGKDLAAPEGHQAGVTAVAYSPDGRRIASAGTDGVLRLWDAAGGKEIKRWGGSAFADVVLAFTPDGKSLAVGAGAAPVQMWDADGNKVAQEFRGPDGEPVQALCFSGDGKLLAIGYRNSGARLVEVAGGKTVAELKYPGGVQAVAVSPDGKLVAGAGSGKIYVWEADGKKLHEVGKGGPVASLAFSPDGRRLAAGLFEGTVQILNPRDGRPEAEVKSMEGHTSAVLSLAFSANGRTLATGSYDQTVILWEVANGQPIVTWKGHAGPVQAVALSPDGRKVVSGSADTTLLVWEATGVLKDGQIPAADLNQGQLDQFWNELAMDDNPKGNRALWTMVGGRKGSVPYLAKKVFLTDPAKITQYVKDLDDKKFAVREKATAALMSYGRWVEGVLVEASKNPVSYEVAKRVHRLLEILKKQGAVTLEQERTRARRILEVLEQSNTTASRELLEAMARGAAEEDLRDTAAAALRRLSKRGPAEN